MTNADNPALAMLKRETDFTGQSFPQPIRGAYSQSASATFASAYANQQSGIIGLFTVTRSKLYDLATIQRETMKASADKKGAFESVMVAEVNGAIQNVANTMAMALFNDGTGVLGQISAITSGGLITFVDPDSVTFFEVGQVLRSSSSAVGTNPLVLRTEMGQVLSVNRPAGQITVGDAGAFGSFVPTSTPGQPTGWVANDLVLVDGNQNLMNPGFAAWIPWVVPASDSFYGQNRRTEMLAA